MITIEPPVLSEFFNLDQIKQIPMKQGIYLLYSSDSELLYIDKKQRTCNIVYLIILKVMHILRKYMRNLRKLSYLLKIIRSILSFMKPI